ncbi:MAG: hypothetical protein R3E88_16360 [Myxococcota bacterium]
MRRTHVLAVAALVAACGAAAWAADPVAYDDAYISYRYADNAVRGLGVVFNPGERVEGYSNPLWVALSAAAIAAGADPFVATRAVGVASYVACVFAIAAAALLAAAPLGARAVAVVPALACLVAPYGLAASAGSGLETFFVAAGLVGLGVALLASDGAHARGARTALLALPPLLVWTRLDAALGVAAAAGALALVGPPRADAAAAARDADPAAARDADPRGASASSAPRAAGRALALRIALVAGAALALLFAARFAYYGAWLPNSYYAKGADEWHLAAGLAWLRAFVQSAGQVAPLAGLAVYGALRGATTGERRACAYAGATAAAYALYVAKVGGDFMHFRFAWAPYLALALGGLTGLAALARRSAGAAAGVGLGVGLLAFSPPVHEHAYAMQTLPEMDAYTELGREVGPALARWLPPDTVVATTLAGTIAYTSRLAVVDQWGLNDREVARGEPLATFQRGHYKPATTAYLERRGVELALGHPEVAPCDAPRSEPYAVALLRLDEGPPRAGARCLVAGVVAPRPSLVAWMCARPDRFALRGLACPRDQR